MKNSSPGRTYLSDQKLASILLNQVSKETRERKRDSVAERDSAKLSKPIMRQAPETTKPILTSVSDQ
jgi:hypothetical protein